MAILDILKLPDPALKQVSEPVVEFDAALQEFIDDLEQTRLDGPAAVGIAAPQVGRFQRIVIIDCSTTRKPVPNHGHQILVNPEITHWEGYEARAAQHEIDHLDGMLFVDRVVSRRTDLFKRKVYQKGGKKRG